MAVTKIPRIKEFPEDGRFWRVDWLGALEPNPQITTEPFVQIIISPFSLDPSNLPSKELSSFSLVKRQQQQTIRVGIGHLPMINIGSIWRDGIHQGLYAGVIEELNDIRVNSEVVQVISANHKVDGCYLLPRTHHQIGVGLNSHLIAIEYQNDPYGILIPAMELTRFYYAVSTNLAHALFSGAFQHSLDSIINTDRTWYCDERERIFLGLRQHVTDDEGWVIARILLSKVAASVCRNIYDGMVRDMVNKKHIHVVSGFPFIGNTNLKVRTKRIPGSKASTWRRLVLSVEYCTAPMPYRDLTILRDNDAKQAKEETDIPDEKKKIYTRDFTKTNLSSLDIQSKTDTNAALSNVVLSVASNRFGVLEGRKPDKPTKEQCEYRSGGLSGKEFFVDTLGTGQGGYGEDEEQIQKANITTRTPRKKAALASFDLFIDAIERLDQREGISASVRDTCSELANMPLTKPSSRRQWGYLDSATKQRRKVIIADIVVDGKFFNLVEFQQRENEHYAVCLLCVGNKKASAGELYQLLLQCSFKNGIWKNLNDSLSIISLNHTWSDSCLFSKSILSRIKL